MVAGAKTRALAAVQLSVEPPLICADVTVTDPAFVAELKSTVMSWQTAVGACISRTVTVNEQIAVLPPASVTVYEIVCGEPAIVNTAPDAKPVLTTLAPGQSSVTVGLL